MITGTVCFDDGEPVPMGNVVFNTATESFFGTITPDGRYTTGRVKEKQGIPDGIYTVWLAGTDEREDTLNSSGDVVGYTTIRHVAEIFTSPSKSPLRFEVKKGGSQTFDIKVERAGK